MYIAMAVAAAAPGPIGLISQGAVLPVTVQGPDGSIQTQAQIDTGSTISSVDATLLQQTGATPSSQVQIGTVLDTQDVPFFSDAQIIAAGNVDLTAGLSGVLGDTLPPPVQVLIGRDILAQYDLAYAGPQGAWSLSPGGAAVVPRRDLWWAALGGAAAIAGVGLVVAGVRREEAWHGKTAGRGR